MRYINVVEMKLNQVLKSTGVSKMIHQIDNKNEWLLLSASFMAKIELVFVLRILTGKKHPKIELQRLRKIRILTFGSLVHQVNSF